MKHFVLFTVTFLLFSFRLFAQNLSNVYDAHPYFSGGAQVGYNDGVSFQLTGTVSNFAQDFPLSLRGSIDYTFLNPGNPLDARKIFINDNTNGTPEKDGHTWNLRLDFMLRTNIIINNSFLFFGPRYSLFTGNFNFIGGNEFFNITTNQFGLGGGIETAFRMNNRMNLVLSAGADYFFNSDIAGHDTVYGPDGENINPRNFTYKDADQAINQPKIEFRIMTGINYFF